MHVEHATCRVLSELLRRSGVPTLEHCVRVTACSVISDSVHFTSCDHTRLAACMCASDTITPLRMRGVQSEKVINFGVH